MTPPNANPRIGKERVTFLPTLSPQAVMIIATRLEGMRSAKLLRRLNLKGNYMIYLPNTLINLKH